MAESNSKLSAPLRKFATDLKAALIKTETQIREMRAREVSTKARKLEKHELCPLCGGPDVNGRCACIAALRKDEGGLDASGGGGEQPMGMSEKAMCKSCGYEHVYGKHKDPDGDGDHDEDGHDEYVEHKDGVTQGKPLGKHMPSSSAAALAPPKPASTTPVGQVNHEMGGFKSIVGTSPVASGKLMSSPKMNVGTAGRRAGNVQAPVAGTIPNAKAEKNFGSARSPLGTGAPGHASQKNMPSQLKAGMAPVAKGEIPAVKGAPEKAAAGTKLPKKGADKTPTKQGSGGEIKKGAKLSKAMPAVAGAAPAGKGVPGKQPIGQGGGDAHKVAGGSKAKLVDKSAGVKVAAKPAVKPMPGAPTGAANVQKLRGDLAAQAGKKAAPAHPDTMADIASAKASGNVAAADRANAQPSPESVDVDVSDFNQEGAPAAAAANAARANHDPRTAGQRMAAPRPAAPNAAAVAAGAARGGADTRTAGQRMAGSPAAASPQGAPDALNGARDQMNAPQKGGVGFLRGLFSMFHKKPVDPTLNPAPVWQQQGQKTSARFNGALPLRRGELSLSELEDDHKEFTRKGLAVKSEMAPPTEGLSSINHNRRMLSLKPGSPRRKKNKR